MRVAGSSKPPACFEIRPGLTLHWGEDAPVFQTVRRAFGFAFLLSEEQRQHGNGARGLHENDTGCPDWMAFVPGNFSTRAAKSAFWVFISCDAQALGELFSNDESPVARRILAAASSDAGAREPLRLPLDLAARFAIESIRRCPFAGACRAMAFAARCHDLIVAYLSALAGECEKREVRPPAEMRIRKAAALLQKQFENPPTLAKLACAAGLSESGLKRGFRRFCGCSVYSYVRRLRMERARQLLESGGVSVIEAATHVGYSNASHFATAFRAHYGENPKTFQMTRIGQE